jgi:Na+-transporting NADH:ubiquinone oxidoreductase subunit NqrB
MQAWNVRRAALYGAMIGVAAAAFKLFGPWSEPHTMLANVREFVVAMLAFGLLCAAASALRNFIAQRLI